MSNSLLLPMRLCLCHVSIVFDGFFVCTRHFNTTQQTTLSVSVIRFQCAMKYTFFLYKSSFKIRFHPFELETLLPLQMFSFVYVSEPASERYAEHQ